MKKLLTLILILFSINCIGQKSNKLCDTRGHVLSEPYGSTAMYCPSYLIDTDSFTIKVYTACNWISYTCSRCGKTIYEREPERRDTIWKISQTKSEHSLNEKIDSTQWYKNIDQFIQLFDKYSKQCHNDSTFKESYREVRDTLYSEKTANRLLLPPKYEYYTWYEHKKPTFEGFINYLKTIKN